MKQTIDTNLEIDVSFESPGPDSPISEQCLNAIADLLRIKFKVPEALLPQICVASDNDNLLTKQEDGCLRVQKDTFHSESKAVNKPASVDGDSGTYLIPGAKFRISSIIMEDSSVVDIPNDGQTFDDPDYNYPADLPEFVDNLNAESTSPSFTWSIEGGELAVSCDTGAEIASVVMGGSGESDPYSNVAAIPIQEAKAGDSEVEFTLAHEEAGIDYLSSFSLSLEIFSENYESAKIVSVSNDSVKVKIFGVSKALECTLKVFTPATRESSEEF